MTFATFKANWSTSVTGAATALFGLATFVAAFAQDLGALGSLIPADYQRGIMLTFGIATALSHTLHGILTQTAGVPQPAPQAAPISTATAITMSSGNAPLEPPQPASALPSSIVPLVLAMILPTVLLGAAIGALTGCAGSAVDKDFRTKVKSNTFSETTTFNPATKDVTGAFTDTLEFRDPSKDP